LPATAAWQVSDVSHRIPVQGGCAFKIGHRLAVILSCTPLIGEKELIDGSVRHCQ